MHTIAWLCIRRKCRMHDLGKVSRRGLSWPPRRLPAQVRRTTGAVLTLDTLTHTVVADIGHAGRIGREIVGSPRRRKGMPTMSDR